MKKTAIVVGTGAGVAVMAYELQGKYNVTILESGPDFKPFSGSLEKMAALRPTGIYRNLEQIHAVVPNMIFDKAEDVSIARGIGIGGTVSQPRYAREPERRVNRGHRGEVRLLAVVPEKCHEVRRHARAVLHRDVPSAV